MPNVSICRREQYRMETLGVNLEQEYFKAIKRAEFRIAKFLKGIITIYAPNVSYSYILWISKEARKE
ncbi:MAG: hypothetical protein ACTSYD_08840 [Candidatus Heimdallarchaeaceae archaeon]